VGSQPTTIEALVSYRLDAIACQGDLALAQSHKLTQQQFTAYRQKILELVSLPKTWEKISEGERFFALDTSSCFATDILDPVGFNIPDAKSWKRLFSASVDWDVILKRFNEQYDDLVPVLKMPNHAARDDKLRQMDSKLYWRKDAANEAEQLQIMFQSVNPPRELVTRNLGTNLLSALSFATRSCCKEECSANTRRELTILAFALAEYQRDHGRFPEGLRDLTSEYLKSIPEDRFTGKPLKYVRQNDGYLLYSVGADLNDDKGENDEDSPVFDGDDDIAIRVPVPPELKK
jgi:hypothetical protein